MNTVSFLLEEEEEEWERRMDIIGQNGPSGEHYDKRECDRCQLVSAAECAICIHNRGEHDRTNYDTVDKPFHYTQGGIECIDGIQAALSHEQFEGYCKGNALKYVWREKNKGGTEDINKAIWYLNKLLDSRAG